MVADAPEKVSQDFVNAARQGDRTKALEGTGTRLERFHQDQWVSAAVTVFVFDVCCVCRYPLLWIEFLKDSKLPTDGTLLTQGDVAAVASNEDERPLPTLLLLQVNETLLFYNFFEKINNILNRKLNRDCLDWVNQHWPQPLWKHWKSNTMLLLNNVLK